MSNNKTPRRDFLKNAAVATVLAGTTSTLNAARAGSNSRARLRSFDFQGVRLGASRWQEQSQAGRDYYLGVSNDDILHGFRVEGGLPAPGQPLGGWCAQNSGTVFGQWLSGMSRLYRATGDEALRDKAIYLSAEWAKTLGPGGDCRMRLYPFEKLVCGLVDMYSYADHQESMAALEKVTDWASRALNRDRVPAVAGPQDRASGRPGEWYTLSENLYRAYQATQNPKFKDFADVWRYDPYWDKFANTSSPADAHGVHAYSHVNSFSSAAMTYDVTGEDKYLRAIKNAYDYLQNTQCFATGGFGPAERLMPPNGSLGEALNYFPNTFETPCGSWAGFKLTRYLIGLTGEARYGDWTERLLYNGVGSALHITGHGKHFYYADYRVGAGVKVYARSPYTCCSGSYIQDMAEFYNQIYYTDDSGLYVNLYLPSEVIWKGPAGEVKLVQETSYPEEETTKLRLEMKDPATFDLKFRVPEWSRGVSMKVNGSAVQGDCTPGSWAAVKRMWRSGDTLEITIPLPLRFVAVDRQHPKRVAVVRGPVVLAQEGNAHEPLYKLPSNDEDLNKWLVADGREAGAFRLVPPSGERIMAKFRPFYSFIESFYYRMYFDIDKLPAMMWF